MDNFTHVINTPASTLGFYCIALYALLKIYFKKRALAEAENQIACDEYIICDITPFILIDYLFAFAWGCDLYASHQLFNIIAGLFCLIAMSLPRTFITNKRIFIKHNLFATDNDLYKQNYSYSNIKSCYEKSSITGKKFIINFKNQKHPFKIRSLLTFCYKPAARIIENAFNDLKETGYEFEIHEPVLSD